MKTFSKIINKLYIAVLMVAVITLLVVNMIADTVASLFKKKNENPHTEGEHSTLSEESSNYITH